MRSRTLSSFFRSPSLIIASLWLILLCICLFGTYSSATSTTHVVYLSHNDKIDASNSDAGGMDVGASYAAGSRYILTVDSKTHDGETQTVKSSVVKRVTVLEGGTPPLFRRMPFRRRQSCLFLIDTVDKCFIKAFRMMPSL
jgi:hypothetical protein